MLLFELFEPAKPGYQDLEKDNSQVKLGDTRKTRLTLAQINQLRIMNDQRTLEYQDKLKDVAKMYKNPPAEGGGL